MSLTTKQPELACHTLAAQTAATVENSAAVQTRSRHCQMSDRPTRKRSADHRAKRSARQLRPQSTRH